MIVEGIKEAERLLKERHYKERILSNDGYYGIAFNGGYLLVKVNIVDKKEVNPVSYLESPLVIVPYQGIKVSDERSILVKLTGKELFIDQVSIPVKSDYTFTAIYPGIVLRRGLEFIKEGEIILAPSFYLGLRNEKQLVVIPPAVSKENIMRWEMIEKWTGKK